VAGLSPRDSPVACTIRRHPSADVRSAHLADSAHALAPTVETVVIASSGAEDVCAVWGRGFGDVDALSAVAAGRGAAMIVRFACSGGPSCSDKNQCCKEMRTEFMGKCHGDGL
jgi:hypothetical protein